MQQAYAVKRYDVHADSSDGELDVGLDIASESEQIDDELLEHGNENDIQKHVRTPPCLWGATQMRA